ncbi:retrovirus-related pol polyprotein from transposon TNT 1-94 [Tanacetum coccineum]
MPCSHENFFPRSVRVEYRTGAVASGSIPPPVTIHYFGLSALNKSRNPFESRRQAGESSNEFMQRFIRIAGFLGQAAGTAEEQAKNFRWGLHKSILDRILCMEFTDVAQVADAARNFEILRDRDDYDRPERSDKRHKSGDQHQSSNQQNSHRGHDQRNDRHGSDRQGGSGNYRNNNSNNHSRDNNRNSGAGRDHRNRGQQSHRATNSGSQQNKAPSEGYTYPVCTTCGRRHPGECRRAAGTCFKCGQAGHLQRDCKKNTGASSSGHADKKPDASGRVFALTQDQAANTTGTITGALFIFGRAVFVLFDTGATHSVISTKFASCFTMTPVPLDHIIESLHNAIQDAGSKDRPPMLAPVPVAEGSSETTTKRYMENYKNVSQDIRDQLNAKAEAVQIILTGIDNDIYSTVDACPNAFLTVQLQPEWQRFVTLVKQSQELKTVSYHKLYDILKQHQNEVNEIRTERLARTANPLALGNVEQADWKDDTDDESDDQELEAHYITRRDLLASLIEKLKCEIDDSKNRNKFLESSNKALVDKLKGEIEDFKTKNKSLESSNNHFKEKHNNELSKTNQLMFKDLKKFQAELDKYKDVNYASKVEIDCAKAKGDLMSYKIDFEKSSNAYTQQINDLNQTISDMKKELCAHQETISIMSQAKEAQIKLYKTREDKELDKVIALENKVKVLNDIVYKTGQSVQTMNMLNRNCKTSFAKPEFLKKAQRANPRLYDIGCYNDNLALMLAPDSDETIRLEKERRSKLAFNQTFDYDS